MTKQKTSHAGPTPLDEQAAPLMRPPGRPTRHSEPTVNVSVTLLHSQDLFLEQLMVDINARTRTRISKSEILRGLIQAVIESEVDLRSSQRESDVSNAIVAKLAKRKK